MPVITTDLIDRGDTRTLTVAITAAGVPVDPSSLTLTIRTPAGVATTYTYGVDAGVIRDSVGVFHYNLTFATAGAWTYQWASIDPTQIQGETVQVQPSPMDIVPGVDARYFTIGEARQERPLDNAVKYPDATIEAMRVTAEQAIEHRCGVAFVPRTTTEIIDGEGGTILMLRPRVVSVTSATIDGTAATGLTVLSQGRVYNASRWTTGIGNISVTYVHGHTTLPAEIKRAALILTKTWLVAGPIDDRATSMSTEDGTFALATPGMRGSSFGIPFVDAVVQSYSLNVAVA